jgi:hypothetical protein
MLRNNRVANNGSSGAGSWSGFLDQTQKMVFFASSSFYEVEGYQNYRNRGQNSLRGKIESRKLNAGSRAAERAGTTAEMGAPGSSTAPESWHQQRQHALKQRGMRHTLTERLELLAEAVRQRGVGG